MLEYAYYPFQKNLEVLDANDLAVLKTVAEGWYVDYKSQPLKKTEDFARHLAAFANQYGGFLFLGIGEANNGSKCAETFPGIEVADLVKLSIQIREAASAHISPPVLYEEWVIKGPCDEIGLPEDRAIMIIGIPKSVNTPHIHSSGRIYRRLADHSDPKPETDRHILDGLWNRGETHRLRVSKFLSETPLLPKSVADNSWAYIYFWPDENHLRPAKQLSFNEFHDVVTNSTHKIKGIVAPMDAVYASTGGFTARQTKNNDPTLPSLTYRWWFDGTARLEIPLNKYQLANLKHAGNSFKYAKEFCDIANQLGFGKATVVDYSLLLRTTSALANIHLALSELLDDKRDIYSSFILKNISFTSPYLDTKKFVSGLEQFSLPLTVDNEIRQPAEPNQNNMYRHQFSSTATPPDELLDQAEAYIFVAPMISWILQSVGVTQNFGDWSKDSEMWSFLVKNE